LTSDKHKKCLENNLYLYYGVEDYKLDSCPKKQITDTPKGYNTSTNCFQEILGKIESNPQDSTQTEGYIELFCTAMSPI